MTALKKPKKLMQDVDALLDAATLPERTVDLCLRGDLHADYQDAEARYYAAQMHAEPSLGGEATEVTEIRAELEGLTEQMRDATLTLRFRAVSKERFDLILVAHPPREDNKDDQAAGFDQDGVNESMIKACCVEPELTAERWDKLRGAITSQQYNELIGAVNQLNFAPVDIPFLFAASAKPSDSDES